ncbi:MAG TPA: beta-1,6-N-acetylglucosaminyltransferase [Longimicrobiaceae bacterium]|nr:beta-1,6-N-acetylglucosaminyltransferase [Longimicrobiaceae bacterium]
MKIAYLVLAHDNPKHLERLAGALSSRSSAVFVHIDRRSSLDRFSNLPRDSVHVSRERIPVYWGDFSQVDAILLLLRSALSARDRFDYFVLLSGTDYPLQPAAYIESFFERNRGREFMNIVRMPCEAAGKPISRLTTYRPRPDASRVTRFGRKLLVRTGVIPARRDYEPHLRGLAPYAGSTWWALSRDACTYILSFADTERRVVEFFEHTVCPDESFFQTILGNSPFRERIERNLTYADWSAGGDSPAYLTEQHLELFEASAHVTLDDVYGVGEALFARKFRDEAADLVVRLDRRARGSGPGERCT